MKLNPPIRAVPSSLFPTAGSLNEVIDLADSKLPITCRNELVGLFAVYHNTLLKVIEDQK